MNVTLAAVFCCSKFMDLAAVETEGEMTCLSAELTKRALDKIQLWTSGDTDPCENSFAWCSSKEMVNHAALKWNASSKVGPKAKIAVSVQAKSMEFHTDEGKIFKRVLCENALEKDCTESRCLKYKCTFERDLWQKTMKGNKDNLKKEFMLLSGCGMTEVNVNIAGSKNSYHAGYRLCCVGDTKFLSIETKGKHDCLLNLFKEKNVPSNRYWLGGASLSCPSVNRWCNSLDEPLIGNHVTWAAGEPSIDSSKECVYMDYDNITSTFTLGKANCKTLMFFICVAE
ncbi:uncharacterized protein LOC135945970 [Cloeon dipterum]|uniref:uncharacterized protein LOC135945970 n=1 Tax=Cloeon dipterum TaxID=197152 RepID=UPI00321FFBF8